MLYTQVWIFCKRFSVKEYTYLLLTCEFLEQCLWIVTGILCNWSCWATVSLCQQLWHWSQERRWSSEDRQRQLWPTTWKNCEVSGVDPFHKSLIYSSKTQADEWVIAVLGCIPFQHFKSAEKWKCHDTSKLYFWFFVCPYICLFVSLSVHYNSVLAHHGQCWNCMECHC